MQVDITCPCYYLETDNDDNLVFVLEDEGDWREVSCGIEQYDLLMNTIVPIIEPIIEPLSDNWPTVDKTFMFEVLQQAGLMSEAELEDGKEIPVHILDVFGYRVDVLETGGVQIASE